MERLRRGVAAAVIAVVATVAASAALLVAAPAAQANVNDFTFGEFLGDYTLSRDDEGRSALHVVETFTAQFPDFPQNKGVLRAIPLRYDDHPVSIDIVSLTRNGQPEPIYSEEEQNGYLVVATGDEDYVLGDQTYQLTYTMRDVTKDFGSHQELYWDTNGTESSQPFARVTAHVHLDPSVAGLYTGDALCFEGYQGSDTACKVRQEGDTVSFASNGPLGAHQNLSFVMKFEAGSFEPYRLPWYAAAAQSVGPFVAGILSLGGLVWALIVRLTRGRDAKGRGIVVAQYEPPKDASVLLSSNLKGRKASALSAQFIDLAVRGKIQLIEEAQKRKSKFSIRLLDNSGLRAEEARMLESTVGTTPGGVAKLSDMPQTQAQLLRGIATNVSGQTIYTEGYRRKVGGSRWVTVFSLCAFLLATVLFIIGIQFENAWLILVWTLALPILIATLLINHTMRPLTEKGAELREYLDGLEVYIKLAEKDRIRVLQSPEGAEREPVDTSDQAQLVKLYERVLPYAMLFGLEQQWARVLVIEYERQQVESPSWYAGASGFRAAYLGAALSSFSTSTATAFAPPTQSSGSGFSGGGGGFSGGGGGGGGFGGR